MSLTKIRTLGNPFELARPHSAQLYNGTIQIMNAGENVEKREPSNNASRNVNWCSTYRKQYGGFSKD